MLEREKWTPRLQIGSLDTGQEAGVAVRESGESRLVMAVPILAFSSSLIPPRRDCPPSPSSSPASRPPDPPTGVWYAFSSDSSLQLSPFLLVRLQPTTTTEREELCLGQQRLESVVVALEEIPPLPPVAPLRPRRTPGLG